VSAARSTTSARVRYHRAVPITIAIVPDQLDAPWWSAARAAPMPPRALAPLLAGTATEIQVAPPEARKLRTWCASVPGWSYEHAPLDFGRLVGRRPSPRRSAGAVKITLRLTAAEHATLTELATARGQIVAQLLIDCALAEAAREAAPSMQGTSGDDRDARALALVREILDRVEASRVRVGDRDEHVHGLLGDAMTAATLLRRDLEDDLRSSER